VAATSTPTAQPRGTNAGQKRPTRRLIRTPREAELVVAEWLSYLGFGQAHVTPIGADEGIDVLTDSAVAHVKMDGIQTSRRVVQGLFGVAAAEGKQGLFFSLGGYTAQAVDWATRVGIPLFQFDLQGEPSPVNPQAGTLVADLSET
jgi:hypothetical protein